MNKKMRFFAQDIGFETDNLLCVGFCKEQSNPKSNEGILLMRGLGNEDDDEVYLEIPPERFTSCGGIKKAQLSRKRFLLEFDRDTMNDLDGIVSMDISFDLDDDDFEAIREVLGEIFDGHACFSEQDEPPARSGAGMPGPGSSPGPAPRK